MAAESNNGFPTGWRLQRLDEVATIIDSLHKTPIYSENGHPMVRVTDVQGGFLTLQEAFRVSDDVFEEFTRRHRPKRGDIVFSRVGTYGNASYVNSDEQFCLGQNTALIAPKINGRFLHLYLQSGEARRQIDDLAVGSTQKTISLKSISALQIPVPPNEELEAIAQILGTLDDKIELNRRMNATLEAMARALFQSWFVDFDPVRRNMDKSNGQKTPSASSAVASSELDALFPNEFEDSELGPIPKGWELKSLDQIATYLNGLALQKFPPSEGETLPVIKIAQLRQGSGEGADRCNTNVAPEYVIDNGDVLFSWSGSLEVELWCGGKGALNQHLFKVTSGEFPKWFYYLWTRHHLDEFRLIAADKATTMGHIQRKHLTAAKVLVPPRPILDAMTAHVSPLIDLIVANRIQSRSLGAIRDALLPKLLNGSVRPYDRTPNRAFTTI